MRYIVIKQHYINHFISIILHGLFHYEVTALAGCRLIEKSKIKSLFKPFLLIDPVQLNKRNKLHSSKACHLLLLIS